ncbi:hypothetical protein LTR17_022028 [Elasticomyces elasticus]|nr:hypothetical protein LTR17_022028 [Elasticomyces elasticus]
MTKGAAQSRYYVIPAHKKTQRQKSHRDPTIFSCPWQTLTGCQWTGSQSGVTKHIGIECRLQCGKFLPTYLAAEIHHRNGKGVASDGTPVCPVAVAERNVWPRLCRWSTVLDVDCTEMSGKKAVRAHEVTHHYPGPYGFVCGQGCGSYLPDRYALAFHEDQECTARNASFALEGEDPNANYAGEAAAVDVEDTPAEEALRDNEMSSQSTRNTTTNAAAVGPSDHTKTVKVSDSGATTSGSNIRVKCSTCSATNNSFLRKNKVWKTCNVCAERRRKK